MERRTKNRMGRARPGRGVEGKGKGMKGSHGGEGGKGGRQAESQEGWEKGFPAMTFVEGVPFFWILFKRTVAITPPPPPPWPHPSALRLRDLVAVAPNLSWRSKT